MSISSQSDFTFQSNAIKTDLSLLLECLKFQMKCPDLQKQALLTIHSICEKRGNNEHEIFIYIVHPDVKETALFTLGTLAEANVYCKNSLCKNEIFADLADCLMNEDIQLKQKRLSVYLLLVFSCYSGNNFQYSIKCFFGVSTKAVFFCSVISFFCIAEEGQRICVAAFPVIKIWLQQLTFPQTEIFQPICTFIAMTVANNSCVQESFSACGGLETLALTLGRLASAADTSLLSCQLSVIISKTLSACITDNYHNTLSMHFTIALCLFGSTEKHQSQLIWCGGLPIIITLLTEDSSEEVRRAATFILQTCKKASKSKQFYFPIILYSYVFSHVTKELNRSINPMSFFLHIACVLPFEEVTSHTFESLQSSCHQSCDRHKVLREATKHFRMHHCRLVFEKEHQDPAEAERYSTAEPQQTCKNWTGKKILHMKRKDFSCEEVGHLLSGVKTYGFSWNLILWSYPFQPGRTNVDLAKKYRRLMVKSLN
uniref:Myb-like domain-containing protein n=1 Tax=Pundamilia nyererei TaxID=303518 RepID=A0A3B4FBH0_9CICH